MGNELQPANKRERTPLKRSKKRITPKPETRKRRRCITELDDLARNVVFERDGHECQRCHCRGRAVQWCHIISRRHLCTRWEPDNALALCAGCHMWWHDYPSLSGPWFAKNWPERHEKITALYNKGGKVNPKQILAEWESNHW